MLQDNPPIWTCDAENVLKNKKLFTETSGPCIPEDLGDPIDVFLQIYEVDRKSKKWWQRILWYFVDVSLVNSYILFKKRSQGKSLSLKIFRLSVVLGLIGANPDLPRNGQLLSNYKLTVPPEIRFDKCAHMPVHGKPRRCAHCSTRNVPHKSSWSCSTCSLGLCLNDKKNCFALFHTK
nr:unnamed protein product [Callosobruchus chinensis]